MSPVNTSFNNATKINMISIVGHVDPIEPSKSHRGFSDQGLPGYLPNVQGMNNYPCYIWNKIIRHEIYILSFSPVPVRFYIYIYFINIMFHVIFLVHVLLQTWESPFSPRRLPLCPSVKRRRRKVLIALNATLILASAGQAPREAPRRRFFPLGSR